MKYVNTLYTTIKIHIPRLNSKYYYSFLLRGKQRRHRCVNVCVKGMIFSPMPGRYLLTPLIFALMKWQGISPYPLKACRFIELSSICIEKKNGGLGFGYRLEKDDDKYEVFGYV